jgi:hypothetical protein
MVERTSAAVDAGGAHLERILKAVAAITFGESGRPL